MQDLFISSSSIISFMVAIFISLLHITGPSQQSPVVSSHGLPRCLSTAHCAYREWHVNSNKDAFYELAIVLNSLPRTTIVEEGNDYIHAEVRSKYVGFVDDLELFNVSDQNIIQARSESRVGLSDLGVNNNRLKFIGKQIKPSNQDFNMNTMKSLPRIS